jgi:polysaccharide pyruvyl transferase CsaB
MKVAVAAWIGAGNLGDELLFLALRQELQCLGLEPVALSLDPTVTRSLHAGEAVAHTALWKAVDETSGLIFGGGGLAQDRTSALSPVYQFARPWLASRRDRSVVAVGLGAEPLRRHSSVLAVRWGLREAEAVVARDAPSARVLQAAGVPRVERGGDLVFLLGDQPPVAVKDRIVVCLAPPARSGGLRPSWLTRDEPDPKVGLVADAVAPPLQALAARTGMGVRFVAMDRHRDAALHVAVADRLSCDVEVATPTLDEVRREFAAAQLVVAARFHGCVLSALAGRPLIALSYAPKVAALVSNATAPAVALPYSRTGLQGLSEAGAQVLAGTEDWAERVAVLRSAAEINRRALERFAEQLHRSAP